jgi:hypothetical protein
MRSSVQTIDYLVLVCYLLLMAGVGAFFMRFMHVGTDFLKVEIGSSGGLLAWPLSCPAFQSGLSQAEQGSRIDRA